ncbi:MAG: hypothetical protein ACRD2U_04520 [Terriglobales bacterium]
MKRTMENLDWAFCVVAFESPSIADSEQTRTYLFDGERLRTLSELHGRDIAVYKVAGGNGFIPVGHRGIEVGPVEAQASGVIVEGVDGRHSVALGFEQADHVYGDAKGNKCFHADPYFGSLEPGQKRKMHGRLYVTKGNADMVFQRLRHDFPKDNRHDG